MNEIFLEDRITQISNLMEKNASGKIFKIFKEVFSFQTANEFSEFVGQVFLIDPDFFFDKFAKTYNKNIIKLLNLKQLFEMEEYVLKKFSLYQNENIIVSFTGQITKGKGKMVGRIYLTNYRIILQGLSKTQGVSMVTTSIVTKAIRKKMQKKLIKKLQSIMSQVTSTELPCFGYQYPMYGLQKIRVTSSGNRVIYSVRLKTETPSGKISSKKYVFMIKVYKFPGENSRDFSMRAREITSIMQKTIVDTSKQFE